MAVHKVPQDVEAEDKFLGPLSFKQFLFFGGALISGFLIYQVIAVGVPFLVVIFLPVFIVCVTLAFPWTKDQPTELWLASRIRFMLVPHKRIWDQDDIKELVTITVPKQIAHIYTDGLSQDQVRSRLNALANVVDSKGWAVKNPGGGAGQLQSDRLVVGAGVASPTAQHDVQDPFDDRGSAIAQQFSSMIQQSEEKRMQNTRARMSRALQSAPQQPAAAPAKPTSSPWFLQQNQTQDSGMSKFKENIEESLKEQTFLKKVHKKQEEDSKSNTNNRMRVVQPLVADPAASTPQPAQQQDNTQTAQAYSPPPPDPAIISLAQNDDLNVETIAREANREIQLHGNDEVVISLHDDEQVG